MFLHCVSHLCALTIRSLCLLVYNIDTMSHTCIGNPRHGMYHIHLRESSTGPPVNMSAYIAVASGVHVVLCGLEQFQLCPRHL